MRTEFFMYSVLRVASGPRVKLASCKSALNPAVVYSADRSNPVSILCKSIPGRHRPVRVADGPMTARCRFT